MLSDLPLELLAIILEWVTSPGIFATVCKRFLNAARAKNIPLRVNSIELINLPSDNINSMHHHIHFLRENATYEMLHSILHYASKHNNQQFVKAFRCFGYKNISVKRRVSFEKRITWGALCGGNIHLLHQRPTWVEVNHGEVDIVISHGHINSIEYLRRIKPAILNKFLISSAALSGHLHIIKWARALGCEWNEFATSYAAEGGHLNTLTWLIKHGCPYNQYILINAIRGKHVHIIQYVVENNLAALTSNCVSQVIASNDLEFIKRVHELSPGIFNPRPYLFRRTLLIKKEIIDYISSYGTDINFY